MLESASIIVRYGLSYWLTSSPITAFSADAENPEISEMSFSSHTSFSSK